MFPLGPMYRDILNESCNPTSVSCAYCECEAYEKRQLILRACGSALFISLVYFHSVDKPWSQVSSVPLPCTCLHMYRTKAAAFQVLVVFFVCSHFRRRKTQKIASRTPKYTSRDSLLALEYSISSIIPWSNGSPRCFTWLML